jgi:hypothetical protein
MTTTQRQRPRRPEAPSSDPFMRGVILVAVAVVLGAILLIKGGGIGFEREDELTIEDGEQPAAETTTTTEAPTPSTSVPPASLPIVALNGAGLNGYAASAQRFLSVAGYTSTTAATAANQATATAIYFAPGYEADAAAVAGLFGLDIASVQPLAQDVQLARDPAEVPATTAVVVVLSTDVQNLLESSGATTETTTTAIVGGGTDTTGTDTTGTGTGITGTDTTDTTDTDADTTTG